MCKRRLLGKLLANRVKNEQNVLLHTLIGWSMMDKQKKRTKDYPEYGTHFCSLTNPTVSDRECSEIATRIASHVLKGGNLFDDEAVLADLLIEEGFDSKSISEIIDWFLKASLGGDIGRICENIVGGQRPLRILSEEEGLNIAPEVNRFLLYCRQTALISEGYYEELVGQIMLLDGNEFDIDDLRAVIVSQGVIGAENERRVMTCSIPETHTKH